MSTIETGTGEGYTARVNGAGQLQTVSTVSGEVTNFPGGCSANRVPMELHETSTELLDEELDRVEFLIQNQGSEPAYIRLGTSSATASDWKIPAGGDFRLQHYGGAVKGISTVTGTTLLVWELVRSVS